MNNIIKKGHDVFAWRLIAGFGLLVMLLALIGTTKKLPEQENFFSIPENDLFSMFFVLIVHIASCLAFLFLLFKPLSFRIYFFFSLIYIFNMAAEGAGKDFVFLCIFCLLAAYRSGYFRKHVKKKIIIASIFFILLLLSQVRYGFEHLMKSLTSVFGSVLILLVTALLLSEEIRKFIKLNHPEVLMLNSVPNLTDRDKSYLRSIFNGEKFAYIASSNHVSLGTVKNRMSELYKILGVADKTELLIRYNDYSE